MTDKQLTDKKVFDLQDPKDSEQLQAELVSGDMYFKLEKDVTYKVILLSSKIEKIVKDFEGEPSVKYAMQIKAEDKSGNKFEGLWEAPKTVAEVIRKNYSKDAVFKITKSGSGRDTRYSVVADF